MRPEDLEEELNELEAEERWLERWDRISAWAALIAVAAVLTLAASIAIYMAFQGATFGEPNANPHRCAPHFDSKVRWTDPCPESPQRLNERNRYTKLKTHQ